MALENIAVWTFDPDWAQNVTETLEWLTSILVSPSNYEQRFKARLTPRRTFEFTANLVGPARMLFDNFVNVIGGQKFYAPIWHDVGRITATAEIGSSTVYLDTTFTEYAGCPAILLMGATPFSYKLAEIDTVSDDHVTLVDPLDAEWAAGTRAYPMQIFRLTDQPTVSRLSDRVGTSRVKMMTAVANDYSDSTDLAVYGDYLVFDIEPTLVQALNFVYGDAVAELDNTTGIIARNQITAQGYTSQDHAWVARGRADNAALKNLFYALSGRLAPVWVPTFFADFDLASAATVNDDHITVAQCGFTNIGGPRPGREDIAILMKDGTKLYRHVLSSALVGDGSTERLALDSKLDVALTPDNVKRISFLVKSRLDSDSIEFIHQTASKGVTTVNSVFRGDPNTRVPSGPILRHIFAPFIASQAFFFAFPNAPGAITPDFWFEADWFPLENDKAQVFKGDFISPPPDDRYGSRSFGGYLSSLITLRPQWENHELIPESEWEKDPRYISPGDPEDPAYYASLVEAINAQNALVQSNNQTTFDNAAANAASRGYRATFWIVSFPTNSATSAYWEAVDPADGPLYAFDNPDTGYEGTYQDGQHHIVQQVVTYGIILTPI